MSEHSRTKPKNKADRALSIKHLKKRVAFNKENTKDHRELMKNGGSKKYNIDHIDHHEDQVKRDEKIIKQRQKDAKDVSKVGKAHQSPFKESGKDAKKRLGLK